MEPKPPCPRSVSAELLDRNDLDMSDRRNHQLGDAVAAADKERLAADD